MFAVKTMTSIAEICAGPKVPLAHTSSIKKRHNPFAKRVHKSKPPVNCDESSLSSAVADDVVKPSTLMEIKSAAVTLAPEAPIVAAEIPMFAEASVQAANAQAIAAIPSESGAATFTHMPALGGLVIGLTGLGALASGGSAAALPFIVANGSAPVVTSPVVVAPAAPADPAPLPVATTPQPAATPPPAATTPPAVSIPKSIGLTGNLSAASDSGAQGDSITNINKPVFEGTTAANSQIVIQLDTNGDGKPDLILTTTSDAQGKWSIAPSTALADGAIVASIVSTDSDGTVSPTATLQLRVDTQAQAPTITIVGDVNNDGFLNALELGTNTAVQIKIGIPPDASIGDILTLTTPTGVSSFTLTADQLAAKQILTMVSRPAEGDTLNVSTFITDSAGNKSETAVDAAIVDTIAPIAPVITIATDANNDGAIYLDEYSADTQVLTVDVIDADTTTSTTTRVGPTTLTLHIDLSTSVSLTDVLVLEDANGVSRSIALTPAMLGSHAVDTTWVVQQTESAVTYKARLIDAAGNVSMMSFDQAIFPENKTISSL